MTRDTLDNLAANTTAAAADAVRDVKQRSRCAATQAEAAVENAYEEVRAQVRRGVADVETTVQREPLLSVMTAGLIGAAVGWLLSRR